MFNGRHPTSRIFLDLYKEEESIRKFLVVQNIETVLIKNTFKNFYLCQYVFPKNRFSKGGLTKNVNFLRERLHYTYIFQTLVNPKIYYIISKFHYSELCYSELLLF